jgi:hypothetical protein
MRGPGMSDSPEEAGNHIARTGGGSVAPLGGNPAATAGGGATLPGGNPAATAGGGPSAAQSAASPGGVAAPGFWLPEALRQQLLSTSTQWGAARFAHGRECGVECPVDEAGAVEARWPLLDNKEWGLLLDGLSEARARAPRGEEFWNRLQAALPQAAGRLARLDADNRALLAHTLPTYTGFSPAMIGAILQSPDTWDLHGVASSFAYRPTKAQAARWRPLADLPGRVRFFPHRGVDRWAGRIPVAWEMPLFSPPRPLQSVVGYGAGNVPGTALIITLLAFATTLTGGPPPAVLVRNSRREPLFSPLVLSALEAVDKELVATVAVLIWDYDDPTLQDRLLGQADLVLAAAGDDTIGSIAAALRRAASVRGRPAVFHPHGHKVSFSAVGREMAAHLEAVSLLTALDSIFWDQFGCLSARVHFVEKADPGDWIALDYSEQLVSWLRRLAQVLPRGAWPLRQLRDTYDRYKALENAVAGGGAVRVVSAYEDPFVVVLDERETPGGRPDPHAFLSAVNDCQGRVVVVRPVFDLLHVPRLYLSLLPASSLQSLSVAVGHPGEGLSRRLLEFATACAECGVTAIRAAGRGAFPRLAYSWDGFLPLDLVCGRPPGHFTTIEFDAPFEAVMESYHSWSMRLGFGLPDGASQAAPGARGQAEG